VQFFRLYFCTVVQVIVTKLDRADDRAAQIFGVTRVGINSENGKKLLLANFYSVSLAFARAPARRGF
jgi:hypothetical protein